MLAAQGRGFLRRMRLRRYRSALISRVASRRIKLERVPGKRDGTPIYRIFADGVIPEARRDPKRVVVRGHHLVIPVGTGASDIWA